MADFSGERTLDPTPSRRLQARQDGRVAQSHDLSWAILLLGALALLLFAGPALVAFLANLLRDSLGGNAWRTWIDAEQPSRAAADQLGGMFPALGSALLPILVGAALLALSASLVQTGFGAWPRRIAPNLSRVSPLAGLRRVFSGTGAKRALFGSVKIGIVVAVAAASVWADRQELASLVGLAPEDLAVRLWGICFSTGLQIGAALLALASLDYLLERMRLEQELKMTPQEMREELRESSGDPQVAARRRDLRRAAREG